MTRYLLPACILFCALLETSHGAFAQENATSNSSAQSVGACAYSETIAAVEDYGSLVNISDPFLGNVDSKVKVVEYFDPNCPHCREMHPIMDTIIRKYGDRVTFYMIPFVLWPYSIPQVEALYVAAQDGKYYEFLNAQYERQHSGGLTEAEVREAASSIGLDPDILVARVQRGLNNQSILARRKAIADLGVRGTPSVAINGRFIDGDSKNLDCMSELIEDALVEE